jgi:hypothetical protein
MPDTGAYLILGLASVAVILGAFVASLFVRQRNLTRDMELIQKLSEEE